MKQLGSIPPAGQTASEQAASVDAVVSELQTLAATFQGANNPAGAQALQSAASSLQSVAGWLKSMPASASPSAPSGTAISLPTLGPGFMAPAAPAPVTAGPTPTQAGGIGAALGLVVGAVAGFAVGRKR